MKDQWVPCSPEWRSKFPGACDTAPRRPGRRNTGVSHYHLRDNPSVNQLAQMPPVKVPGFTPKEM